MQTNWIFSLEGTFPKRLILKLQISRLPSDSFYRNHTSFTDKQLWIFLLCVVLFEKQNANPLVLVYSLLPAVMQRLEPSPKGLCMLEALNSVSQTALGFAICFANWHPVMNFQPQREHVGHFSCLAYA